jgi:uncharacterized delta-60 repeat protein
LLSAGDLDPAFGAHGVLTYPDIAAPPVGLATQSDGKFLVATATSVYRFRADGSLDRSFGRHGHVTPGFTLHGLGIDHNGRIAVGGGTDDFKWAAARYKPDGTPDTSFNHTGQIIVPTTQAKVASVMTLQPDGKILVGGTQFNGNPDPGDDDELYDATVIRFNTNGTVDTAFGANGQVPGYHLFNLVNAIALAPNGNILIAGQENLGMSIHDERFEVVDSAGRPVTGHAASTPDFYTSYRAASFRPDGVRVLGDEAMGNSFVSFDNHDVGVWFDSLSPDGYTDEKINAILTTADNKTVLAGRDHDGNVGLIRFNPDGTPDNTFGFGGSNSIDLNHRKSEWIDRLALLPNGDFLAAGSIGGVFPDDLNPDAHLFIARIKGGAHPVGDLAPRPLTYAPIANTTRVQFTVTYAAEESIDATTLGSRDIRVVGPHGYSVLAHLTQVTDRYNGRQRIATYTIEAPGGAWNHSDNGRYTVYLRPNQVQDNRGHAAPAQILGRFKVHIPRTQTTVATATLLPSTSPITTPKQRRKDNDAFDLLS